MSEDRQAIIKFGKRLTFDASMKPGGEMEMSLAEAFLKELAIDVGYEIVKQKAMGVEAMGEVLDRVLDKTNPDEMRPSEKLKAMIDADPETAP
jgi:hypothetical protein